MKFKKSLYYLTASMVFTVLLSAPSYAVNAQKNIINKVNEPVIPFVVTKGTRYNICNDVADYINNHRAFYDSKPRELFSIQTGKFSKPKMPASTFERYVQIRLQSMAYNPIYLTGHNSWKKTIKSIEETMSQDLAITEFTIDINNDGVRDKVFSYSFYREKAKTWVFINYVLNDKGNHNLAFEKRRVIDGELFYYDGRTFMYRHYGQSNRIYENFPSYEIGTPRIPENMLGLRVGSAICEISPKQITPLTHSNK